MMKKFYFFFLLLFCICLKKIYGQEADYKFSHLTVNEGLSHTDANGIVQDAKGYIWIGTYSGLDRFDGYDVTHYYNDLNKLQRPYTNRILGLCIDSDSNIWLATEGGIQCFNPRIEKFAALTTDHRLEGKITQISTLGKEFVVVINNNKIIFFKKNKNSLLKLSLPAIEKLSVNNMVSDVTGDLWFSSTGGTVGMLTPALAYRSFSTAEINANFKDVSPLLSISKNGTLYIISKNTIWQSTLSVHEISSKKNDAFTGTFKAISISGNMSIRCAIQDAKKRFWIGTSKGLIQYDQNFDKPNFLKSENSLGAKMTSDIINNLFIDRSGCLWITTFGGGVNMLDVHEKLFHSLQSDITYSPNTTLIDNHIRSLAEQDGHILWIATNTSGLDRFDFYSKTFKHYKTEGPVGERLQSNSLRSLAFNNIDKKLWIASVNGIDILDTKTGILKNINDYSNGKPFFFGNELSALGIDKFNQVWVGSWNDGLSVIRGNAVSGYQVQHLYKSSPQNYRVSSNKITFVYADPVQPRVFIGTDNGIDILSLDNYGHILNLLHFKGDGSNNKLSSNYIWPIVPQDKDNIWVGTLGGGLNYMHINGGSYTAKAIKDSSGYLNDVESLLTDKNGNVWMGGNGLFMYSPKKNFFTRYDYHDGLQGNSFKVGAACKGQNNRLYFGGINGINYFDPDSIKTNDILAQPVITNISVNNHIVKPNNEGERLFDEAVSYLHQVDLNHLQNNFVVHFSAMHFANPYKCQYRFKLEGFETGWKYVDAKIRSAAYSNLPYGTYKFILEASNNDGLWNTRPTIILFNVHAPWYNSRLAQIIYAITVLLVLSGIYYYQGRWYKLKKTLELQQMEERKKEEIHQLQLQFFTNISHELRTPLTLIAGPLEKLVKEKDSTFSAYYHAMQKNVYRLLSLINELMDFRKVESGGIRLHVKKGNINEFVREIQEEFEDLSINRDIKLIIKVLPENFDVYFDHQVLEKILINLIDNSFKYSKSGTTINIDLYLKAEEFTPRFESSYVLKNDIRPKDALYIKVSDQGVGISEKSISHIFDRYYRINDSHIGSGVGLALVKSLVLLHKGDISVYSKREAGTDIIVSIPYCEDSYTLSEKALETGAIDNIRLESLYAKGNFGDTAKVSIESLNKKESQVSHDGKLTVLLVDDNDEIREFIKSSLSEYYRIEEASNGSEGLAKTRELHPDLIISDVMMPELDGNQFCELVKNDIEISHIPFVMLTAKTSLPAKLEGAESGADIYFSKPISIELLLTNIRNLLNQREKIKQYYLKNYNTQAKELVHNKRDREFIETLIDLIHQNIENENMDIDFLCSKLAMSHSKLYQKLKSLTSQTISEFIRSTRLRKAVDILTHEDVTMSEVMYRVGIQSQSYFTRAFKKEFGKTPSQFLQELNTKV